MKLDIGCGRNKHPNCIGLDSFPFKGVDIIWDLGVCPWPFKDNAFDDIYAYSVIEHLPDLIQTMEEIYRISKPNGKIHIVVPHYRHRHAYHFLHKTFFMDDTFKWFTGEYDPWITSVRFKVLKLDYIFTRVGFVVSLLPGKLVRVLNSYINGLVSDMCIDLEPVKQSSEEIR